MKVKWMSFALILAAMMGHSATAQDVSGSFNVVCVVSDATADPKANNPLSLFKKDKDSPDPCEQPNNLNFHLGDHINLMVEHAAGTSFEDTDQPKITSLVLFLDGRYLPGTYANELRSESGDETENEDQVTRTVLSFDLTRDLSTPEGRKNWKEVVSGKKFGKTMTVSTGLEKGEAVPSNTRIQLVILTPVRFGLAIALALALGVVFWALSLKTGVLRDKEPAGPDTKNPTKRAYSLSRVQAMLWTLLAAYAFLFVYFLTGEYNATVPGSVVTLMAISLGTFGTAAAIDSNASSTKLEKARAAKNKVDPEYSDLVRQKDDTAQEVQKLNELKPATSEADAQQHLQAARTTARTQLAELSTRLRQDARNHRLWTRAATLERSARVSSHSGFWSDLFSNEGGAGMHRVQFGLWTVVLMIVFVYEVFQNVSMPDFDKTLLALMGVSSGAYAGLKIPEKKGSDDNQADDDSADNSEDESDDESSS